MTISDSDAAKLGWLALVAENIFTEGAKTPKASPLIAGLGWEPVALLVATDVDPLDFKQGAEPDGLGFGATSYYGFLAHAVADPTRFVVVVRGTMDPAEWAIDARFPLVDHPEGKGMEVENGFWSVYQTMQAVDLDGAANPAPAAQGLRARIGTGSAVVVGHSLGSALATYLTYDLVKPGGPQVSACLFASPHTGNAAWVAAFDAAVKDYALFNYILDVVPKVPFDAPPLIQYSKLPRERLLDPRTAQANIVFDVASQHHVICYSAMLDYADTAAWPGVVNEPTWTSVIGPVGGLSLNHNLAVGVAAAVAELEDAGRVAVRLISVAAEAKGTHV
jgi:triacylglycerol lipase